MLSQSQIQSLDKGGVLSFPREIFSRAFNKKLFNCYKLALYTALDNQRINILNVNHDIDKRVFVSR